jgi:glycerophosphoryl diester phosphodiesterase
MKVFAHRGSSLIWPENTLLAFRKAHEAGATGFETDLRLSSDGEIMLCHDPDLGRIGHPGATVESFSAQRLKKLRVRSADGRITDNVIDLRSLLTEFPDKDYIFDCKISDRALFGTLKKLLASLRFHDRIWFLTWSAEADGIVSELFEGYLRFPSYRRSTAWGIASVVGLGRLAEPSSRLLSLPAHHHGLPVFSRPQVASLEARGKIFVGYLVNDRRDLERCRDCGVDVVLTDRPDLI